MTAALFMQLIHPEKQQSRPGNTRNQTHRSPPRFMLNTQGVAHALTGGQACDQPGDVPARRQQDGERQQQDGKSWLTY